MNTNIGRLTRRAAPCQRPIPLAAPVAIAEEFAHEGARVAVVDVNEAAAASVADGIGTDQAIAIQADVSDVKQVDHAVARTIEAFGSIEVLVNNAGVIRPERAL